MHINLTQRLFITIKSNISGKLLSSCWDVLLGTAGTLNLDFANSLTSANTCMWKSYAETPPVKLNVAIWDIQKFVNSSEITIDASLVNGAASNT